MNVSFSFKELATKQYTLTAKERLIVIIAVGILVIGITIYVSTSQVAIESTSPDGNTVNKTSQPMLPIRQQAVQINSIDQPLRNPFAKLPEVNNPQNTMDSSMPILHNNVPNGVPGMAPGSIPQNPGVSNIPDRDFKLTGIVSGENQQLAVIMSGSKSKAYAINDVVGTYHIKAIHTDDVVLSNSATQMVLRLESVGQKEGKTSDK